MGVASFCFEKMIIPTTIMALSVATTIAYQQYSSTSNLSLHTIEQSIIVESVDAISELDVIYEGKK